MKSISRFCVLFLTTCLLINAFAISIINAQPVDTVQAKLVAKNFYSSRLSQSKLMIKKSLSFQNLEMFLAHKENGNLSKQNDLQKSNQLLALYYIFNVKDKINSKDKNGFVIVSADERVPAILGYSFEGEFSENDDLPAFKDWMDHYKKQIVYVIQNNLKPDPKISENWKKYSSTTESKGTEQLSEVTHMLTTKWSQRGYCNNLCPADERCTEALNGHVPAGCVAVAMAQIMKHYGKPTTNNPIPGYTDDLDAGNPIAYPAYVIPNVGVTTYDWGNMIDDINIGSPNLTATPAQIDAVSTLIYHCGVAVKMDYSPVASGAGSPFSSDVEDAFKNYFKYSPDIHKVFKSDYSDDAWAQLLKTELNNNRLIYYSGYANNNYDGGHAFVCDGYQDVDPGNLGRFFYFCFGEGGGGGNGYFNLSDITPGNPPDVYTFKQWAIIGISPVSNSTITDADGNQYNTVTIGEQTWMAENLKATHFNNGHEITNITSNGTWTNPPVPFYGYCLYNNNAANKDIYGALYNWQAVNTKALCPSGWHVPTNDEWEVLVDYLGIDPGRKLKTGRFGALLGGGRSPVNGTFDLVSEAGAWWSSTAFSGANAWGLYVTNSSNDASIINADKNTGASVRCIKGAISGWTLTVGAAATFGNISTPGEEIWYKFLTDQEGTYVIQTYGSTDTHMYLYNSDQTTMIAKDNNAKSGHNSKIVQNLDANTWYYVKINGYDNTVTGSYSISINVPPASPIAEDKVICEDGTGNQVLTATAVAPESSVVVWFDAASDGNIITNPILSSVGTVTYYAASQNSATLCYSLTRTAVKLTINGAPAAPVVNNVIKTYNGLSQTVSTSVPSGISVKWYNAETGGTGTAQPAGTDYGSYTAFAEAVNDETKCTSLSRTRVTLTINKAELAVAAKDQSSQYSDPLKTLTYEITGFVNGETSGVVTGSPEISTTATQFSAPGDYPISISIGTLSATNYTFLIVVGKYTIIQEDAIVTFTGATTVSTSSGFPWLDFLNNILSRLSSTSIASTANASSGLATVTLRATVQDISETSNTAGDIYPGDIRLSKVRFFIKDGTALTDWLTPTLVNPADLETGVVSYDWKVNIGTATQTVYTIGIEVNHDGYYSNNQSDYTTVTIYKPTGDFIAGGGYINPTSSAGTYASDPGLKTNFGFVVTYKINGTNWQGSPNIIFRRKVNSVVHTYQIISNSITSLGVNVTNPSSKTAVFVANASLTDITKPGAPISIGGNLTLQVNMTDKGDPGTKDLIAISLWNGSKLLYSSKWTGASTTEMLLSGGNLVVHSGFSFAPPRAGTSTIISDMPTEIPKAEFSLKAYPNPFTDHIYFDLQLNMDSKVRLEIFDINGSKITTVNDIVVPYDNYVFEYVPENLSSGIFIYRLLVNGKQMFVGKLIHF